MTDGKFVIMFVCTGNSCRSPMAAGALRVLLQKERPGAFDVISAGTNADSGYPATMFAIEAAKIWNADISGHRSQQLTRELIEKSDLIFAMTPAHLEAVRRLAPAAKDRSYLLKRFPDSAADGEGVQDPIGQDLARYNETFIEIGEYLGRHLPEIVKRIDARNA